MSEMTPQRRRVLEQVKAAGRQGLFIERGAETVTHEQLVVDGLIFQYVASKGRWKYTLSRTGKAALEAS